MYNKIIKLCFSTQDYHVMFLNTNNSCIFLCILISYYHAVLS